MSATPTHPQRHAISADEYLRMEKAGVFATDARLELMEGEIIEMAPIGSAHAAVVNALASLFNRTCGAAIIVSVQNPFVAGERSVPQPDLMLLKARDDKYFHRHPSAVDVLLVVEVSDSTLRFDLEDKMLLYAQSGVVESWVIDLEHRVVHMFQEPDSAGYRRSRIAVATDMISPGLAPQITLTLGAIFPEQRFVNDG
jgi:Uma2 family endonuclease